MIPVTPADYLEQRVGQYRNWYDAKARRCKLAYLALRCATLLAAALIPAGAYLSPRTPWPLVALATLVLLCLGFEEILRLRQQWENYRYTEQYLDREHQLFAVGAGVYRELAEAEAFLLLVERVEWAISAENSTTLATMSLSPDAGVHGGNTGYR